MAKSCMIHFVLLLGSLHSGSAITVSSHDAVQLHIKDGENPIRPVITMLQDLLKSIEERDVREGLINDDAYCLCKKQIAEQQEVVDKLAAALQPLENEAEMLRAEKIQLEADIAKLRREIAETEKALKDHQAMYDSTHGSTFKEIDDLRHNIAAIGRAVNELRRGLGADTTAFLQTSPDVARIRKVLTSPKLDDFITDDDRDKLTSFLEQTPAPADGDADEPEEATPTPEIIGMLTQIKDNMQKDLDNILMADGKTYREYLELKESLEQKLSIANQNLAAKITRLGEVELRLVQIRQEIAVLTAGGELAAERRTLQDILDRCREVTERYEKARNRRAEEMAAVTKAIQILSADTSLELFKKTLPAGAATTFLQLKATDSRSVLKRAQAVINKHKGPRRFNLDLLGIAQNKRFSMKVINEMIDDLVRQLKAQQKDELKKKKYCEKLIRQYDGEISDFAEMIRKLKAEIASRQQDKENHQADIDDVYKELEELEKMLAMTEEEYMKRHEAWKKEYALQQAALGTLRAATDELQKVYEFFLQTSSGQPLGHDRTDVFKLGTGADPAATAAAEAQASSDSAEVIALLKKIMANLQGEMDESKSTDAFAHGDYEKFLRDAAASKEQKLAKIQRMMKYMNHIDEMLLQRRLHLKKAQDHDMDLKVTIGSVHVDCDWLIQNWDARNAAIQGEINSLWDAYDVLNQNSFLQKGQTSQRSRRMLRGGLSS